MKILLLLLSTFFLNATLSAQIPNFKLTSQHLQFPVNSLAGKNNLVYFNHGDSLKTGDVSNPDTMIILNSIYLESSVSSMEISGDRLYAAGTKFFIIDISVPDKPTVISKTDLPSSVNSISENSGYYYLGFKSAIGILNIADEKNPTLDLKSDMKGYYFLKTGINKLIAKKSEYIHIFNIESPENPVEIDSIKQEEASYENFAIYKNNLIVGRIFDYPIVYDLSGNNNFAIIDTLKNVECSQFYSDSKYLIGISLFHFWGISISFFNLKDWPELKAESTIGSEKYPNSIMTDSVKTMLSFSDTHEGITILNKKWESTNYFRSYRMIKPFLKDSTLLLPEVYGWQIYNIVNNKEPELVSEYYNPPTDFFRGYTTQMEMINQNIYVNEGDIIDVFPYPKSPDKNIFAFTYSEFTNFVITGPTLWTNDKENHTLIAYDLNSETKPKLLRYFGMQEEVSDFLIENKKLYTVTTNGKLNIYDQDISDSLNFTLIKTYPFNESNPKLFKKDSLIICTSENKNILFKQMKNGDYSEYDKDSNPAYFNDGSDHLFQNKYLFASGNTEFLIYDMTNPENPILVNSLLSPGKSKPSGVYVNGNKVVLTSEMGGFSIYDFTGFTDKVDNSDKSLIPQFTLFQNYPNPFNPSTTLSFDISFSGQTDLSIFNLLGQKLQTVHSGFLTAGRHDFHFDGSRLPSGVYLAKLKSGSGEKVIRMMLIK